MCARRGCGKFKMFTYNITQIQNLHETGTVRGVSWPCVVTGHARVPFSEGSIK